MATYFDFEVTPTRNDGSLYVGEKLTLTATTIDYHTFNRNYNLNNVNNKIFFTFYKLGSNETVTKAISYDHIFVLSKQATYEFTLNKDFSEYCDSTIYQQVVDIRLYLAVNLSVTTNISVTKTYSFVEFTPCITPTECYLNKTRSENDVIILWSNAEPGIANEITGYGVQYSDSVDGDTWGSWEDLPDIESTETSGSATVDIPIYRGYYRKYRIRTQGSAGSDYYSDWIETTNTVQKNRLPDTPTIIAPTEGSRIFNKSPRILIKANSDPDGDKMKPRVYNGAGLNTNDNFSSTSLSNNGKTTYKHPLTLDVGIISVNASMGDSFGVYSSSKSATFELSDLELTDSAIVSGETYIKAVHMTELQTAINDVRGYYGLPNYDFTKIISGETSLAGWTDHVKELRNAIDEIITFVNSFDSANSTNDISPVSWLVITENKPRKDVIDEIRGVIPLL